MIETGMVVSTTMPDSILPMNFPAGWEIAHSEWPRISGRVGAG